MATNPKDLTVNYQDILKASSFGERAAAPRGRPELLSALTPTELAAAFPEQYKRGVIASATSGGGGAPGKAGTAEKTAALSPAGAMPDGVGRPGKVAGGGGRTESDRTGREGGSKKAETTISWLSNKPLSTGFSPTPPSGGSFVAGGEKFFNAIMNAEGTNATKVARHGFSSPYDVVLGYGAYGRPDKPLSQMTIGDVYKFQRNVLLKNPKNRHNSSAAGAFQIVSNNIIDPKTGKLSVFMRRAGLTLNDTYGPEQQKKLAYEIYKQQGLGAWEGFKFHPDQLNIASQESRNLRIENIPNQVNISNATTKVSTENQRIDAATLSSSPMLPQPGTPAFAAAAGQGPLIPGAPTATQQPGQKSEEYGNIKSALNLSELKKENLIEKFPQGQQRFFREGGGTEGLNPKLIEVLKEASKDLPPGYHVRMFSGVDARKTGTRNHPGGVAVDLKIVGPNGEVYSDRGFGPGHKAYEQLAQSMEVRGKQMFPGTDYIWGGAWNVVGGDRMHYQIKDPDQVVPGASPGSGQYSWEKGVSSNLWAGPQAVQQFMSPKELEEYRKNIAIKYTEEQKQKVLAAQSQNPQTPVPEDAPKSVSEQQPATPAAPAAQQPPAQPATPAAPAAQQPATPAAPAAQQPPAQPATPAAPAAQQPPAQPEAQPPVQQPAPASAPDQKEPDGEKAVGGTIPMGAGKDDMSLITPKGKKYDIGSNEKFSKLGTDLRVTPAQRTKADTLLETRKEKDIQKEQQKEPPKSARSELGQPRTSKMDQFREMGNEAVVQRTLMSFDNESTQRAYGRSNFVEHKSPIGGTHTWGVGGNNFSAA